MFWMDTQTGEGFRGSQHNCLRFVLLYLLVDDLSDSQLKFRFPSRSFARHESCQQLLRIHQLVQ